LLADSEYLVRVIATNAQGDSTPSRPVRASTLSALVTLAFASGPDAGRYTSFQIHANGQEFLSHYDAATTNVLFTMSTGGLYTTTTVDTGPTSTEEVGGDGTSIALENSGKVHIVAHDQTSDRLRYITNESGLWVAKKLEYPLGSISAGAKPRIVRDPSSGNIHIYHHSIFGTAAREPSFIRSPKWGPPGIFPIFCPS
jgi:hypothetical protein